MNTKAKYWFFYVVTAMIELLLIAGILLLFWGDLSPEEERYAALLAPKLALYAVAGMIVNMFLFASMLTHIFKVYIDPIVKLAEETQLIAVANAKYRIVPEGGREVVDLTTVINDLADKHIALKTDVQQIVQYSKDGLDEEKRRLETLMAQIPEGVIVCNVDGRVLLYNHQAQRIAEPPGEGSARGSSGSLLGLGRSVFAVVDRSPIVYALNYLQNQLDEGVDHPAFNFTTSRHREQFIRVRMAPVTAGGATTTIDGYILTLSDITSRMQADSRRDIFLQSLTIGLQRELNSIRDAVTALEIHPSIKGTPLAEYSKLIDGSTNVLLEQIDDVAIPHAGRLQDPGEAEHILGNDLMNVLHETIVEKFGIDAKVTVQDNLWLNINSYTVLRGVIYLMGQLTNHLDVESVELDLRKEGTDGYLSVHWLGDPVKVKTIEEWKQCPLMTRAKNRGPVGLANLLAGRGDISSKVSQDEEAVSVRFRLEVEQPESKWTLETKKNHRPIFYEFDLFEAVHGTSDSDNVPLPQLQFVVFDTETTGLDPSGGDEIISIAGIRIVNGKLLREEVFDQLVDPKRSIPLESLKIHEIYPEMLSGMPSIDDVLPRFHEFAKGSVLVAHNAAFDMKFLEVKEKQAGVTFEQPVLDTLLLSALVHPNQDTHNLDDLAERLGLPIVGRHTALGDAILTGEALLKLIPLLEAKGITTLAEARAASRRTAYGAIEF